MPQVGGIIGNINNNNSEKVNSKESQKDIAVANATVSKRDSGINQNMQILDSS